MTANPPSVPFIKTEQIHRRLARGETDSAAVSSMLINRNAERCYKPESEPAGPVLSTLKMWSCYGSNQTMIWLICSVETLSESLYVGADYRRSSSSRREATTGCLSTSGERKLLITAFLSFFTGDTGATDCSNKEAEPREQAHKN